MVGDGSATLPRNSVKLIGSGTAGGMVGNGSATLSRSLAVPIDGDAVAGMVGDGSATFQRSSEASIDCGVMTGGTQSNFTRTSCNNIRLWLWGIFFSSLEIFLLVQFPSKCPTLPHTKQISSFFSFFHGASLLVFEASPFLIFSSSSYTFFFEIHEHSSRPH